MENVIVADADYVDSVAFDMTVNFERMLERRVPPADMAQWVECIALDGGMPLPDAPSPDSPAQSTSPDGGSQEGCVEVVLVHNRESTSLRNFTPSNYQDELHGKAVRTRLGEFSFSVVQTEEIAGKEKLLLDLLQTVCQQQEVRRLMVVVSEQMADSVRQTLRRLDSDSRRTTLFTMQPVQGGAYRQELLGYSLMAALGISGKEIEEKLKR